MTSTSRMGRRSALTVAATLTGLLAGCANAGGSGPGTDRHARQHGATMARAVDRVPVAGSRSLAAANAQRLLGLIVLPAGARRQPARPLPKALEQPGLGIGGPGNTFDQRRLYRLPMTMARALAFLRTHKPRGTTLVPASGGDGVSLIGIAFSKKPVPPGINQINLIETLVPGPKGSSLLRADAQVIWYPARSTAEYLTASRFRSVRITLTHTMLSSSKGKQSIQGGQSLIRPLAEALNSLHATPLLQRPCPMPASFYKLVFAPAVRGQQAVIVTSGYCGEDQVSVGGRRQPALSDTGTLSALVTRLVRK